MFTECIFKQHLTNRSIIGAFYFTLGNLSPKYRFQLTSIYLVALVKSSFITIYKMDAILRPFVNDVKKLVCTYSCSFVSFILLMLAELHPEEWS